MAKGTGNKWEDFKVSSTVVEEIEVPFIRATRRSPKLVFRKENKYGPAIKMVLRGIAKKFPEYHLKIKNPTPDIIQGRDNSGNPIPIDTLGRWAWGVPGYMGHLIFEGFIRDEIVIYIPDNSPKELIQLLQKAINQLP